MTSALHWIGIGCWFVTACGASVPTEVHRSALAEQRTAYEARLFDAERARLACITDAERARSDAKAGQNRLELRIQRLERASRSPGERPRAAADRPGRLSKRLARALGAGADVRGREDARWRVPLAAWFDAGSTRLRPLATAALTRLADLMADQGGLSLTVAVGRPEPGPGPVEIRWHEAGQRGTAVVAALQSLGVVPSRLTLSIGGDGPDGRIVFILRSRGARRRR